MVFAPQRYDRRWHVRAVLFAAFLLVASVIMFVRVGAAGPGAPCGVECFTGAYVNDTPSRYIVLTFDDGPAGRATDDILAVLEERQTPATFFLVGRNIIRHPEQVRRIADAGHIIGNHTYTHAESLAYAGQRRMLSELDRTNALIESITGRSAILYRPIGLKGLQPFEVTPAPGTSERWDWLYERGYVTVGVDLDSNDWQMATKEGVIANMREQLDAKETMYYGIDLQVALLHDLPQTAAALPEILDMIEERGFEVVPLTYVLGLSEDEVMPPVVPGASVVATTALLGGMTFALPVFFVLAFLLMFVAVLRIVTFTWFKLAQRRQAIPYRRLLPRFQGTVSVLIPAYNEAENVRATILSVLQNTRQPDEIIVIDDGSTDETFARAEEMQAKYPGIVRVITQRNAGKSQALNNGLRHATGEVVVAIDGDTVLDVECIDAVVRPFAEPRIGATAGKIVPANTDTMMEKYQHLEYMVGQNIDKQVVSALGSVNIVPGAVGAWRRDAVLAAGGYSTDTLVEDQDLTLALLGMNYGVVYVPDAIAYTEVPRTVRSFYTQRFRWTYGTFQCIWKYRSYLWGDRALRLGWISLPYAFLFNVLMPVSALFINMFIIMGIIVGILHPGFWILAAFTLVDIFYAYIAFLDEPRRSRKYIALVPLQRFAYLFVYSAIIFLVVLKVLDGSPTRWNKLKRLGSAERFFNERMGGSGMTPTPSAGY